MRSARAVRHTGRRDSTCQSDAATVGGSRGAESRTGGNRAKPDAAAAKVADLVVLDLDTVPAAAPLQVSARATRHGAPRGRGRRGPATRVAARRVVRKRLRGRARPDHHPAEGVDLYNGGGLQGCPRGVSDPGGPRRSSNAARAPAASATRPLSLDLWHFIAESPSGAGDAELAGADGATAPAGATVAALEVERRAGFQR